MVNSIIAISMSSISLFGYFSERLNRMFNPVSSLIEKCLAFAKWMVSNSVMSSSGIRPICASSSGSSSSSSSISSARSAYGPFGSLSRQILQHCFAAKNSSSPIKFEAIPNRTSPVGSSTDEREIKRTARLSSNIRIRCSASANVRIYSERSGSISYAFLRYCSASSSLSSERYLLPRW